MSERMPVAFVSHGAPDALLNAPDTVACWHEIGQQVLAPTGILVVSAHWEAPHPMVSAANTPETIPAVGSTNDKFGRRFKIVSFRWIGPSDL